MHTNHETTAPNAEVGAHDDGRVEGGEVALNRDKTVDPVLGDDGLINVALQEHAANLDDWKHAELLSELNAWCARFNDTFFSSALPPPALSIERARVNCLGWYLPANRDGLGLRYRVGVNALHVERARALVLGVVLHELTHQWEEVVVGRRSPGGSYHTVAFRKKASALGIPTCRNGIWGGIVEGSPFAKLLAEHGVAIEPELKAVPGERSQLPPTSTRGRGSRLAKWDCGCTKVWASSGVVVSARCARCERPFERQQGGVR